MSTTDNENGSSIAPLTEEQKALVTNNIKLAYFLGHLQYEKMAANIHPSSYRSSTFSRDEVLQFAQHGLIAAARLYRDYSEKHGYSQEDIAAGHRFSGFARQSIIGAILNAQVKEDHVHPLVRARYKKILAAGYRNDQGAPSPSMEELAKATGMTVDRVYSTIQRVEVIFVSTDTSWGWSEEENAPDSYMLVSPDNVESSAVVSAIQTSLVKTMEDLPTVEQVIVAMRYYYNMNFSDIASELCISSTEVSSLHRAAVTRIHSSFRNQVESAAS